LRGTTRETGDDNAVATVTLGSIQCIVGELQKETTLVGGFPESGYADRNGQHTVDFTGSLHVQSLSRARISSARAAAFLRWVTPVTASDRLLGTLEPVTLAM